MSNHENLSAHKREDGCIAKESLIDILKGYMWTFSSGVNVRQSFAGNEKKPLNELPMFQLWSDHVEPHVKLFVTSYITCRLSKHRKG